MKLYEMAHSRTGDKVDISNISVIAYKVEYYEYLKEHVTPERVKEFFKDVVHGDVVRYELPKICALNFVMDKALGGGATRSLNLDAHGKCLCSYLGEMEI